MWRAAEEPIPAYGDGLARALKLDVLQTDERATFITVLANASKV
jgi:hypothetical protein